MRLVVLGAALLVLGGAAIVTGVLPTSAALAVGERVWPILLFAVAVTVVAELASIAGVFEVVASLLARVARGRVWVLWLLVVVLAVVSTAFLSLDTTAVLLTPVVVVLARAIGISPLPFALTTVWLANTASLVLPVSNLTNLLALRALDDSSAASFVGLLGFAATVAVIVPSVVVFLVFRRVLVGRFTRSADDRPRDRLSLLVSGTVLLALFPLLVVGLPPWLPASVAALVLVLLFAARNRSAIRFSLVPWQLVLFALGLFLVVDSLHALGLTAVLAVAAGDGEGPIDLLRLAAGGLVGANVADNLPAYLALEPVAGSPQRIAALLIGVNAGPLITPWASLATLLWHARLRALGVEMSWRRYMLLGLAVAPVTVALATLALAA